MKFMDILHIKKAAKQNIIGRWLISLKDELLSRYYYHRRKKFIPQLSELVGGEYYIFQLLCQDALCKT